MKMKIPHKRLFLNNNENRGKTQETLLALHASLGKVRNDKQVQSAAKLIFQ